MLHSSAIRSDFTTFKILSKSKLVNRIDGFCGYRSPRFMTLDI